MKGHAKFPGTRKTRFSLPIATASGLGESTRMTHAYFTRWILRTRYLQRPRNMAEKERGRSSLSDRPLPKVSDAVVNDTMTNQTATTRERAHISGICKYLNDT